MPHGCREENPQLARSDCRFKLEEMLEKEVDLLSLRKLSTVFQKEVVMSGRMIYCKDHYVVNEFEMLMHFGCNIKKLLSVFRHLLNRST